VNHLEHIRTALTRRHICCLAPGGTSVFQPRRNGTSDSSPANLMALFEAAHAG
jgi:hypothetical protein